MITCQKCRALLEPGTRECPYCHSDQRHHAAPSESQDAEKTTRFGLWILGLIVGIYFLMVAVDPARDDPGTKPFEPSNTALDMFGAADPFLVDECGQTWRLLASLFLHVDLLHLAFNAIALFLLIPIAAGAFGIHRTVCLYFFSGLCGAVLSNVARDGGVGASGALCGLIGASAVFGKRRGGAMGDALMRRMIGWAVFIGIYGVFLADRIDNMGHLGGFLGGAALGYFASGARARGGRADRAWMFVARATVVGAIVVAAVFWVPFVLRISERREMQLYRSQAERTLRAVAETLHTGNVENLPETLPDGPRGTDEVRDAIQEALNLARAKDRAAGEALAHASDALEAWSTSLACTHCMVPSTGFDAHK
ncbi:MAG TPA: rhomboid family intramembrane serine protease [Planctomycetota bacterium]|nr:rhomboid family intramembrane serine protease [Planctomycetota bacterium]